jgi:hypothetical protein
MRIITKKHIPRRTILRGLGASIALPFLDSMIPAFASPRALAAAEVKRFGTLFVPMGMTMSQFTPKADGPLEQLPPILQPLAPFRDRIVVFSGLDCKAGEANDGGVHPRAQTGWATSTRPLRTEGANIHAGVSMDQVAAQQFGKETQLTSLELTLEAWDLASTGCQGYSCAYNATTSWRTPTSPLPMEANPTAVFERLFGASDSTDLKERLGRLNRYRSILDGMNDKVAGLQSQLGPSDRTKLSQYVESIRDIERRIQKAVEQSDRELPLVEKPVGIPSNFQEHGHIMFDLLALALQTDLTRVFAFAIAQEQSLRAYPEIGANEPHHPTSHHGNIPDKLAAQAKINTFHMTLFAHFLKKLESIQDGAGTLLDHTLMVYGSGMSDGNTHHPYNVPTVLVGNGTFSIAGGRHVRYAKGVPFANLQLTMLHKAGVNIERYGDSTEVLSEV